MKYRKGKLSELTPELFRVLYFDQKKSLREIADICGVSHSAIHKWFSWNMKDRHMRLRPHKESKCVLDPTFLEVWTPELAYVLGLFATDGNIGGKNRASLTSTDLELVEKVRSLLRTDHPIRELVLRGVSRKMQYKLDISSAAFVAGLEKHGIVANKSLVLGFPQMPKDCIRHFLRGCWDGDGSFYYENKGHKFKASYVSGSMQFMAGFVDLLRDIGICKWILRDGRHVKTSDPISIYKLSRGKSTSYSFRLSGDNAISFGLFIYESVPEEMYLLRKYHIFRNALAAAGGTDIAG